MNCGETSSCTDIDQASNVGDIRRQIAKWQRAQKDPNVRKLKEHEHFEITVTSTGTAYIACKMCVKKCQLGSKNKSFLISNWTRHIGKCDGKKCSGSSDNRKIIDYSSTPSPVALSSCASAYESSFEQQSSPTSDILQGEQQKLSVSDETTNSLEDLEDPLSGDHHGEQSSPPLPKETEQQTNSPFQMAPPALSPRQEGDSNLQQ